MTESLTAFTERRLSLRPRSYQIQAVDAALNAFSAGESTALIQAATGAGKTIIFSLLIRRLLEENPNIRIAVLAHRRELIAQARDKLLKVYPEVELGVACSSLEKVKDLSRSVTLGSIQTLARQAEQKPFDLIIIDEVHRLPTKDKISQMGDFLNRAWELNPKMHLLGVTATPFRLGHGYIYGQHCQQPSANWFNKRHYHINISTLQEEGFLSSYNHLIAESELQKDLENCHLDAFGEYEARELENTVIKREHLQSAVQTLVDHGQDRRSVVIFCVSITHADKLKEAFLEKGILCASVHSELSNTERDETLRRFNQGEIRILTNVGVLTEGWDAPRTDTVMLCRPTQSASLYIQMVGRGLRTFPGKSDCLILDLAGCYEKHGSIKSPIVNVQEESFEKEKHSNSERHCPECREIIPLRIATCPYCQRELKPTVVSVDKVQVLVAVEEEVRRVIECDACQTPYRFDELQLELMSDDLDVSPLGIWYCPHEHPIKAMEPTQSVSRSGEYDLLHIGRAELKENKLVLRAIFLDRERDPYSADLVYGKEQLSIVKQWLKVCGIKNTGIKKLEDTLHLWPEKILPRRPSLTLTVAKDGCFVEFCS